MRKIGWVLMAALAIGTVAAANIDERQEAIAMAWIDAHNTGDVDAMAAFRAKHFRRSTVTDWKPQFLRSVEDLGELEPYGVMIEQSGTIKVGVNASGMDGRVRLRFVFHDDEPEQLKEIGLDAGGPGGEPDDGLPSADLGDDPDVFPERLDAYLSALAADGFFSGNVLVADADGVRFEGAYGLASREFGAPNTLDTRFDVGSCTKDYTRVAILRLAQAGRLSLDDTVGKHLPDYPNATVRDRVTVRQLLDHRSGLGDYFTEEWWQTPMSKLREVGDYLPIWGPKPLVGEPGERERYSNFGYTVLGAIIEKVTGQRYDEHVTATIFEPLGMDRSGFFETDAVVPDVAVGYTHLSASGRTEAPRKNIYVEPAKGGPWGKSYSTLRDFYTFYDAMLRGKVLTGEENFLRGGYANTGAALAGGGPGLNAMAMIEDGVMVLVLANQDPPIAGKIASRILAGFPR